MICPNDQTVAIQHKSKPCQGYLTDVIVLPMKFSYILNHPYESSVEPPAFGTQFGYQRNGTSLGREVEHA
jgi:hypothetical protein